MTYDMPSIGSLSWAIAVLGAVMVGMAKNGVPGLSILFVAAFAAVFPSAKQASGIVLPLLIAGDWIAIGNFRRHLQWRHLGRLFPWTAAGVVAGYFALGALSDHRAKVLIGLIILTLALLSFWQRRRGSRTAPDDGRIHWGFGAFIGVIAGFTTLVANAGGPLMAIYLVAMRLPKLEFVGTAAVFFAVLNLFKVPFMANLGLLTRASLLFDATLVPAVIVGAVAGRYLLTRINQRVFEQLVLGLSTIAGLVLLF